MQIDYIVCPDEIEEKLASKHGVTVREARQVLLSRPRIRFVEKGYSEGDDVYAKPIADKLSKRTGCQGPIGRQAACDLTLRTDLLC